MRLGVKVKIAWEMPVRASVVMSGTGICMFWVILLIYG